MGLSPTPNAPRFNSMAKQCSSKVSTGESLKEERKPAPTEFSWEDRVFKNFYVRDGLKKEVRGWSVRLQHEGTRKTFSLRASERKAAAAEAREIHRLIRTQGWEAALRWYRVRRGTPMLPDLAAN